MKNNVDELLLDLGYEPEQWREMQMYNYEQMCEGKKFYSVSFDLDDDNPFNDESITCFEPWEGQRP